MSKPQTDKSMIIHKQNGDSHLQIKYNIIPVFKLNYQKHFFFFFFFWRGGGGGGWGVGPAWEVFASMQLGGLGQGVRG